MSATTKDEHNLTPRPISGDAQVFDAVAATLRSKCAWMTDDFIDEIAKDSANRIRTNAAARATDTLANGGDGTFLGLPAEIRNIIYEMVLKTDDGETGNFQVRPHEIFHRPGLASGLLDLNRPATSRPGLLSVSSQIRSEALPLFYAINTFAFTFSPFASERAKVEVPEVRSWLETIGSAQAGMIKDIKVRFWFHDTDLVKAHTWVWLASVGHYRDLETLGGK